MEVSLYHQKKFGSFYSIVILLGAFFTMIYSGLNLKSQSTVDMILSLIQPIVFILASTFYFKEKQIFFTEGIKVKKFSIKYLIIAIVMSIGLMLGFGYVNIVIGNELVKAGAITVQNITMDGFGDYVKYVIGTAIAPAVGEEILFRGVVLYTFVNFCVAEAGVTDGKTDLKISFFIGITFALFHANPAQIVYQFAWGFALTLIAIRTGSILPSVLMHFLNNFLIITCMYVNFNPFNIVTTIIGLVVFIGAIVVVMLGKKFNQGVKFTCINFYKGAWVGVVFSVLMMVISILTNLYA